MEAMKPEELRRLFDETTKKIEAAAGNIETNTILEELVASLLGSEYASVWVYDDKRALLLRERAEGTLRELSMLEQQGVLARCFLTLSGGIYNYLASEKEYRPAIDNPDDIRMKSKIILPLFDSDQLVGMVTGYSSVKKIKNFEEQDMELLEALAPFLINVLYRMHPQILSKADERLYVSDRLLSSASDSVVEKVEAIQQNEQPNQAPDELLTFLSNTVHDIRTPANTLYGFLELLEDQLENPRLLQYVRNAKESAQFINQLTTSILDRTSSQQERAASKPVQLNPAKFFADIAGIFSANMSDKQISFNVYIDPIIAKEVVLEDMKVKRVVMNLIGNAYKFTPSNGTIDFSVKFDPKSQQLSIAVKDTGIGIAEEQQQKIFEAFKQADDSTGLNYGGTGLGLSISAEYVRDLGGELKLSSEVDAGSTFYFDMPVKVANKTPLFQPLKSQNLQVGILFEKQENLSVAQTISRYLIRMGLAKEQIVALKQGSEISEKITHLVCFQNKLDEQVRAAVQKQPVELLVVEEAFMSLINDKESQDLNIVSKYGYYANTLHTFVSAGKVVKVLVADDDRINIELIRSILENAFCKIDTVMDGEAALELYRKSVETQEPYSLVYLDKQMPKRSGLEVVREIRATEKEQGLEPIHAVYISGDPMVTEEENALFDICVGKPFKKEELKKTLEDALK